MRIAGYEFEVNGPRLTPVCDIEDRSERISVTNHICREAIKELEDAEIIIDITIPSTQIFRR